jgi:hypothetical protein
MYVTTTRAVLRTRIRERVFETFWSDTELNLYIDEGLKVWNVLTAYHRVTNVVSIPANTVFFSLEDVTDHQIFLRAEYDDYHLINLSLHELDKMNRTWMCGDDFPLYVAPVGLDHLVFYPIALTDNSVVIESISNAPLPTADGDFIQMAEEDIPALIDYVHFLCTFKEGGNELQVGLQRLQDFLKHAATYNSRLNQISIYRNMLGYGGFNEISPAETESQWSRHQRKPRDNDRPRFF